MKQEKQKEWYTSGEAALYLKIPAHRIARLRREGRLKGVVGGGENPRYAMYRKSDLDKVDSRDLRKKPNTSKTGTETT
jgi:Helix-turn-helix domain